MSNEVLVTVDDRGTATLTLNRPEALNAFNVDQIAAFDDAMAQVTADSTGRVIVIAGSGPVFCSGADLNYLKWAGSLSYEDNRADARKYAAMGEAVYAASQPVVARAQGGAYGGGVAVAAACDIVIAESSAKFAITEARYGFTPSLMVPYLLGRLGQRECRRWCLTGEAMSAAEAFRIGLADIVVEDDLDEQVAAVVDSLLMNSPGGLAESKAVIGETGYPPIDAAMIDRTLEAFVAGRGSDQASEGADAFIAKRPPNWATEADA
jgi:methylglutaconyl-CoA hydratase